MAIMGPSGSGKSTLLSILGCLDRPTTGEYRLGGDGRRRPRRRPSSRASATAASASCSSPSTSSRSSRWPRTSRRRCSMAACRRREWRERALRCLERVGLLPRADHRPSELSGGEAQRAAIARALVTEPRLLLADEPTGNLDTVTGDEIAGLLDGLQREGRTVVLVTHNEALAARAQRHDPLRDGRVGAGARERLSAHPPPPRRAQPAPAQAALRASPSSASSSAWRRSSAMSSVGEGARREAVAQIGGLGIDTHHRARAPGRSGPGQATPRGRGRPPPARRGRRRGGGARTWWRWRRCARPPLSAEAGGRAIDAAWWARRRPTARPRACASGRGRFLTDLDVEDRKRVAVLGASIAHALFPFGDARGASASCSAATGTTWWACWRAARLARAQRAPSARAT